MTLAEFWKSVLDRLPEWLSAIGTIGAVVVALFLARRDSRIHLEVSAGHRILLPSAPGGPIEEYVMFSAINVGHRPATVATVGWRFGNYGRFRRFRTFGSTFAVQVLNNPVGQRLPVTLKDGEQWTYLEPLDDWAKSITADYLKPATIRKARKIHFLVVTSTGAHFLARIETGLQKELVRFARGEPFKLGSDST